MTSPAIAKNQSDSQNQPQEKIETLNTGPNSVNDNQKIIITPTGNQIKSQNQTQTKNQSTDNQLKTKIQETEKLNEQVSQSFTKVSDQVKQLIETTGAKGGIGQQVKVIAQDQEKAQNQIKSDFEGLTSQGSIAKLFFGSDKKLIKSLDQKLDQNKLMVQQLEQLKLETKNEGELQQLQETIDLMIYQNTSLQNTITKEKTINGMFGWLINMFN